MATRLVLVVSDERWIVSSIESILRPEGYSVLTAVTGTEGMALASRVAPDLVLVSRRLRDQEGVELCRGLRTLRSVRASTPIVMLTADPFRRRDETEALEAGAWALLSPPFDPIEIISRLGLFVDAKRDTDAALESSFLDPSTGFYNIQGLLRRIQEATADASRAGRPIACVVVGPDGDPEGTGIGMSPEASNGDSTRKIGALLARSTRSSDAIGRVSRRNFVVLAPGTDQMGAQRLAERVMEAFDQRPFDAHEAQGFDLRAGYHTLSPAEMGTIAPEELLRRAATAQRLTLGTRGPKEERIRAFPSNHVGERAD